MGQSTIEEFNFHRKKDLHENLSVLTVETYYIYKMGVNENLNQFLYFSILVSYISFVIKKIVSFVHYY